MATLYNKDNSKRLKTCRQIAVLLFVCILSSFNSHIKARTYILCIGIQNYPGRANDTYLCEKDAQTIKSLFEKNGESQAVLLISKQATRQNILANMRHLFAKANTNDAVAIFYSGHGDRGVLCAYDGDLTYESIWNEFDRSKAKRRFAFINACYSGTMRKRYNFKNIENKNILFFLSSRSSETSAEILTLKNGLFTNYLNKGLKGAADKNNNRIITAKELYDYVSENVIRQSGNMQHPVMWGKYNDNTPIMVWK